MSTKERLERLRLELRYLTVVPPRKRGARLQSDIDRIKLRISMLTEDERGQFPCQRERDRRINSIDGMDDCGNVSMHPADRVAGIRWKP